MKKKMTIILLGCLLLLVGGTLFLFQHYTAPVSSTHEEVIFTVESGASFNGTLADLEEQGLIKNKTFAKIYAKLHGFNVVKANTYQLDKSMSLKEILTVIGSDYPFEYLLKYHFTVIEGSTVPQVAATIAQSMSIEVEDVLSLWKDPDYLRTLMDDYWFLTEDILSSELLYPLEGYLFPDTYTLTQENPTLDAYTRLMLDRSNEVLSRYRDRIENTGWTMSQFLSFCSVVQREAQNEQDYSAIAGVFMNRLNINMPLQSDITVLYALQRTGVSVSVADTQIDSKYNTYRYPGLPIGPISNVSESIISHCLDYEKNDFYFFVALNDGKGTVVYTKTYEEHEAAIEKAIEEGVWW